MPHLGRGCSLHSIAASIDGLHEESSWVNKIIATFVKDSLKGAIPASGSL
jgi:hypothetical protein